MKLYVKVTLTTALIAIALAGLGQLSRAKAGLAEDQPILLAQLDEGDVDESYDSYGPDLDEEIEYDEALMHPEDSTKAESAPELTQSVIDSLIQGIRWFGQAAFLIENDKNIYIDPFELPGDVPPADIILITHDHRDHFSPKDIEAILTPSTVVVSIDAVRSNLPESVEHFRLVKPGSDISVKDIHIEVTRAYNVNKRFHPRDKDHVGFIVDVGGRRIYHAGDTDLIPEMKHIDADIALLPIGGTYTMDAIGAALAAQTIDPRIAIPMHWGKIVGTREDAEDFRRRCKIPVIILDEEGRSDKPKQEQGDKKREEPNLKHLREEPGGKDYEEGTVEEPEGNSGANRSEEE